MYDESEGPNGLVGTVVFVVIEGAGREVVDSAGDDVDGDDAGGPVEDGTERFTPRPLEDMRTTTRTTVSRPADESSRTVRRRQTTRRRCCRFTTTSEAMSVASCRKIKGTKT